MSDDLLAQLTQDARLWQASQWQDYQCAAVATTYPELDTVLAGGGWPVGSLTELLCDQPGIGELTLLLPALAHLSQQPRWQAWVAPPFIPYGPALEAQGVRIDRLLRINAVQGKARLWAMEQALRSGSCSVVLGWLGRVNTADLRRLQLAAKVGDCCGFLFRPLPAQQQHSPVPLRLVLKPHRRGLQLHILKRRGGWPVDITLPLPGRSPLMSLSVAATPVTGCGQTV